MELLVPLISEINHKDLYFAICSLSQDFATDAVKSNSLKWLTTPSVGFYALSMAFDVTQSSLCEIDVPSPTTMHFIPVCLVLGKTDWFRFETFSNRPRQPVVGDVRPTKIIRRTVCSAMRYRFHRQRPIGNQRQEQVSARFTIGIWNGNRYRVENGAKCSPDENDDPRWVSSLRRYTSLLPFGDFQTGVDNGDFDVNQYIYIYTIIL